MRRGGGGGAVPRAQADGERISICIDYFGLLPPLLRCEPEHEDAKVHVIVSCGDDSARRTDAERLLVSLGLPCVETPSPKEFDSMSVASAAEVCRLLLHGTLGERFNAAYVLYRHVTNAPWQSRGAFAPATLDALCVAALSRVFIAPAGDTARRSLIQERLHDIVTGPLRLLPARASAADVLRAALGCLQMLALETLAAALAILNDGQGHAAAAAAAVQRMLQLKLHTDTLKVARKDPEQGLPQREQHRRLVALRVLNQMVLTAIAVQPPPKQLEKLIEDARAVALEALLDPSSRRHLRAAAVCRLASVVSPPRGKLAALAAGAMQHCVDIYSVAGVYTTLVRTCALQAAGNMSYAARDAASIEPHTTYLFAQLQRYAAQPTLLDAEQRDDDLGLPPEEVQMLYRVIYALGQIAPFDEFRPLFDRAVYKDSITAVTLAVVQRQHTQHIGRVLQQHLLASLAAPPTRLADALKFGIRVTGAPGSAEAPLARYLGDQRLPEPGAAAKQCSGCATPGLPLKLCSACRTVAYCSVDCQRAAWKGHKAACRAAVAAREHARLVNEFGDGEGELEKIAERLQKHAEAATKPTE